MRNILSRRGRDPDFKCTICGKYVSYDRRTIVIKNYMERMFSTAEEQYLLENVVQITHRKCMKKGKKK